jgi:hypothetical protein
MYHQSGEEIKPAQVGTYWNKPPMMHADWSVTEEGDYMLFYLRALMPEGFPVMELREEPEHSKDKD